MDLQIFEFETATVEPSQKQSFFGKERLDLCRYYSQAQGFVDYLDNEIALEMIYIPGGIFLMGSPESEKMRSPFEGPQHQISVQPFFISRHPITVEQWQTVAQIPTVRRSLPLTLKDAKDNFSKALPSFLEGENPQVLSVINNQLWISRLILKWFPYQQEDLPEQQDRLLPVSWVSWLEAVEFCDRLAKYSGHSYRLPKEVEWEYACRASTKTPYSFGEKLTPELACYKYPGINRRTPVMSYPANSFGLYDMHGNVWEWCDDVWKPHYDRDFGQENRPLGAHVLRGGDFRTYADGCRSASRIFRGGDPTVFEAGGFRVCFSETE